jgi:hypothetical protein
MQKFIFVFFLPLFVCCADTKQKVSKENLFDLKFYNQLMQDIEYFDAEAIDTRNRTKAVSWEQYKTHYRSKLEECHDADCAKKVFLRFAEGFVNLHSNFEITGYLDPRIMVDSMYRAHPSIVFEYPSLRMYEPSTAKEITHLNSIPVKELMHQFINYECSFSSTVGCATIFIRKLNANWLTIADRPLRTITYSDGTVSPIKFKKLKRPQHNESKKTFAASMKGWETVVEGNKFVLMRKSKTLLLKYVDFLYDDLGDDLYCENSAYQNSMCQDIQLLTESIRLIGPVEVLVIDLQNNIGGAEVTPLLAAFAKQPFYDLSVRFRKTPVLENDTIRPYLFWSNSRLENWFSTIRKQESYANTAYGAFLPACADFCRGSENCELQPIQPAGKLAIGRIVLVTNYNCVSSCDDFVWRMKDYANAIVAGQPQAADATYSRIRLAYYTGNSRIYRKEFGPGQTISEQNLFYTATIPNSAVVNKRGKPMQGLPASLDCEVPIRREHFEDMETYTLNEVLKYYELIYN